MKRLLLTVMITSAVFSASDQYDEFTEMMEKSKKIFSNTKNQLEKANKRIEELSSLESGRIEDKNFLIKMIECSRNGTLMNLMDELAQGAGYSAGEFNFAALDASSDFKKLATAKGRSPAAAIVRTFIKLLKVYVDTNPK